MNKILPSAVIPALCLLSLACSKPDPTSASLEHAQPVALSSGERNEIETAVVSASLSAPILAVSGRITYGEDRFPRISSPLQGRVLEVRGKLGDPVKAGDVMLVVDSPDIATAYSDYVKEISELSLAERNYELAVNLYKVGASGFSMGTDRAPRSGSRWPS